ncbi:MAG: hypothetical protein K0S47_2620 [Herbinix sp.]|jgi:hypothetical protein|nr:hypothetical protein [Herbinix sp.]
MIGLYKILCRSSIVGWKLIMLERGGEFFYKQKVYKFE